MIRAKGIEPAFPAAHGIAYRPEIDGLRAIAVVSVILYHGLVWPFSGGYAGVDIFFVISGYLISSIILSDVAAGRFTFLNFYERRVRRIFPALFVVLAFSTALSILLLTPLQLRNFGQSLVATLVFASNVYFRRKSGYFNEDTENSPLIHMWSLSVEEQFYLFFPIILLLCRKRGRTWLAWLLAAGLAGSLVWCIYLSPRDPIANFFLMPSRAWELLAGALVSIAQPHWKARAGSMRATAAVVELIGGALMIAPLFLLTRHTAYPGVATIPVVLGAALVILAANAQSLLGRVLAARPLVGIGLVSYSAYLWHQPLFAFARAAGVGPLSRTMTAILIAATFGLAWISWRFVERPFRRPGKIGRWPLLAGAATVSAALALGGLVLHIKDGFPSRFGPAVLALQASAASSPMTTKCHADRLNYIHPEQACHYFVANKTTWATFGDSHAIEIGYALAEDLRRHDEGLVHLTFSGCQAALTFQSENPGCSAWIGEAVDYLVRHREVRNVLFAFRYSFYLHGDQLRTYPEPPSDRPNFLLAESPEAATADFWHSVDTTVGRLLAAGKHLYVVKPIPDLPVPIDRYIFGGMPNDVGVSRAYYARRHADALAHLAKIARLPGVTMLDPVDAFCNADQCFAIRDGKAMYYDDSHPSLAGVRHFVAVERARGLLP